MYEYHIELLNKMYSRIKYNGWRRGTGGKPVNYDDACCLLDTMDAVQQFENDQGLAYRTLGEIEETLRHIINVNDHTNRFAIIPGETSTSSLIEWNDYKHRKVSHVYNLIDECMSYYMSEQEGEMSHG